ncbi:MAG: DUF1810 domain-containing protein [Allobranchiibius sp.]
MSEGLDQFDLDRFVCAQDADGIFTVALGELHAGAKRGHWMWFVFPQVAGLGSSRMSQRYAVSGVAEARAYLAHPLLRSRLLKSGEALLGRHRRSATEILGEVDAAKLQSSMTLFVHADPDQVLFTRVLERYFEAELDPRTQELLGS